MISLNRKLKEITIGLYINMIKETQFLNDFFFTILKEYGNDEILQSKGKKIELLLKDNILKLQIDLANLIKKIFTSKNINEYNLNSYILTYKEEKEIIVNSNLSYLTNQVKLIND